MHDKKMISIDQFTLSERVEVEDAFKALIEKHRQRTGKEPDAKQERAFTAEARQQIMTAKMASARAQAEKARKTPARRKKPESLKESEVNDFNWKASVIKGRR